MVFLPQITEYRPIHQLQVVQVYNTIDEYAISSLTSAQKVYMITCVSTVLLVIRLMIVTYTDALQNFLLLSVFTLIGIPHEVSQVRILNSPFVPKLQKIALSGNL